MAKKTSYALKQLVPEENSKTGTKYSFKDILKCISSLRIN